MSFKSRLKEKTPVVAPGIYDALTASVAEATGFEALYLSGAGIAYTRLGRPDIGLVSMFEVAETLTMVCDRVEIPVIVDADTGYGNALNVERCIRLFEKAGARAIQLEDQTMPKRCGHLADKQIIPASEMVGKIQAAVDSRKSEETLIVGRTDSLAIEGVSAAIERAQMYAEAGADVLFVEAPRSREDLTEIAKRLGTGTPLLANMVEGGSTPIMHANDLGELGYSIVIFPGGIVRFLGFAMTDYYRSLKENGSNRPMADRMFDFTQLNEVLGTPEILARGQSYETAGKKENDA